MSLIKDDIKRIQVIKYVTVLGDTFDTEEQATEFLLKKYLGNIFCKELDADFDEGINCEIPDIVNIIMANREKIADLLMQ